MVHPPARRRQDTAPYLASGPLPRRLARRARRHLGLPAERVALLAVDGGAWLDIAERAGVWFSPEQWAAFLVDAFGLALVISGETLTPAERAAVEGALAMARNAAP